MATLIYELPDDYDPGDVLPADDLNLVNTTAERFYVEVAELVGNGVWKDTDLVGVLIPGELAVEVQPGTAFVGGSDHRKVIKREDAENVEDLEPNADNYIWELQDGTLDFNTTGVNPGHAQLLMVVTTDGTEGTAVDNLPAGRVNLMSLLSGLAASGDRQAGTLQDKLVAGDNIVLTVVTDGDGIKTIRVDAEVTEVSGAFGGTTLASQNLAISAGEAKLVTVSFAGAGAFGSADYEVFLANNGNKTRLSVQAHGKTVNGFVFYAEKGTDANNTVVAVTVTLLGRGWTPTGTPAAAPTFTPVAFLPPGGTGGHTPVTLAPVYVLSCPVGEKRLVEVDFSGQGSFANDYTVIVNHDQDPTKTIAKALATGKTGTTCFIEVQNASDATAGSEGGADDIELTVILEGPDWTAEGTPTDVTYTPHAFNFPDAPSPGAEGDPAVLVPVGAWRRSVSSLLTGSYAEQPNEWVGGVVVGMVMPYDGSLRSLVAQVEDGSADYTEWKVYREGAATILSANTEAAGGEGIAIASAGAIPFAQGDVITVYAKRTSGTPRGVAVSAVVFVSFDV